MKNPHLLYFAILFSIVFTLVYKVKHSNAISVTHNQSSREVQGDDTPILEVQYGKWKVFSIIQGGKKVCYIASSPVDTTGNHSDNRTPYLMISQFNHDTKEISVSAGYKYRGHSNVAFSVDGVQFNFIAESDNVAWPQKYGSDNEVIAKMLKGFKVLVFSESTSGTYAVDTYSLEGLHDAYNKMIASCAK